MSKRDSVWILVLVVLTFLIVGQNLVEFVPAGRDWARYWHPILFLNSKTFGHYGVLWQEAGGFLPVTDPSTWAYDPVWLLLTSILTYQPALSIYLTLLCIVGSLSAYLLARRIIQNELLSATAAVGFCFSGLSIALFTQQFIPIYIWLPFAALQLLRFFENQSKYRLIAAVFSMYYLGYSAVPNYFLILIAIGALIVWRMRNHRMAFLKVCLYSFSLLVVPYASLAFSVWSGLTPDGHGRFAWAFQWPRLIHLILPEVESAESRYFWINNIDGGRGAHEPYFSQIFFPLIWFFGVPSFFSRSPGQQLEKILRIIGRAGLVLLLFSMVGKWLPIPAQNVLAFLPTYWGRYPEKLLLIAMPLIGISAMALYSRLPKNEQKKQAILVVAFFALVLVVDIVVYPEFRLYWSILDPVRKVTTTLHVVLSIAFALLANTKTLRQIVLIVAMAVWLVPGYLAFKEHSAPFGGVLLSESVFLKKILPLTNGETVFLTPKATLSWCIYKNSTNYQTVCPEYDFGGISTLSMYSNHSATSYTPFKFARRYNLHQSIVNFKPRYVILGKDDDPAPFCDSIKAYESIRGCEVVELSDYTGKHKLLELTHANTVKVNDNTTPYFLSITATPEYDAIRVPFFLPPGTNVKVDGTQVPFERDDFGFIIQTPELSHQRPIKIEARYPATLAVLSLALGLLSLTIAIIVDQKILSRR